LPFFGFYIAGFAILSSTAQYITEARKCTIMDLFKQLICVSVIYFIFKMFYLQGKPNTGRNSTFASIRLFYLHNNGTAVIVSACSISDVYRL